MKLVSVIVPVYNVEKYLPDCLDSILASTYSNLEIIVVDDGSTDSCPSICDEYALKDKRIRVIHQENQGLIGARNTGLAHAIGTYIGFVDSDDLISPLMYELLVKAMEMEEADIAACEYCYSDEHLCKNMLSVQMPNFCMKSFAEQLAVISQAPSVRNKTWSSCYVWNKLYRREHIQEMFHNECLMCEDLRFNWDYIHYSKKMVVIQIALYMYRLNEQSITAIYKRQRKNSKLVDNGIANATLWSLIANDFDSQENLQLKDYLCARAAYTTHGALWRVYSTKQENKFAEYATASQQFIKANCSLMLHDRKTYSAFLRFMCWLCSYCFPIWKLAARISRHVR